MDLLHLTAAELGRKIKNREVSVAEAVKAVLAQAKEMEPEINSYVTLDEAGALMQAESVQKRIDSEELTGPLAGVPAAVKDNRGIEGPLPP
ncbi:amidase family protein [Schaedlerella sp.]|uniref:amidase family protein n=1 Tax=Schaedlerella sp. TaxID=2676057 RepID=UPI003527812F